MHSYVLFVVVFYVSTGYQVYTCTRYHCVVQVYEPGTIIVLLRACRTAHLTLALCSSDTCVPSSMIIVVISCTAVRSNPV